MRAPTRPDHRGPVRPRTTPEAIHRLIARLTPRDLRIMRLVHDHRVFTTDQLARLEFGSYNTAKKRLPVLYALRALDRFRPWTPVGTAPWHYVLDAPGAEILAAEHGQTAREFGYRRDRVLTLAYRSSLTHTLGVNEFFVDLTAHTRTHSTRLAWRTARDCEHQFGDIVRPDAAGRWTDANKAIDFFLEYDTGTEPLRRLEAKLDAYHELARLTGNRGIVLFRLPSAKRADNLHHRIPRPPVPTATAIHGTHPAHKVWTPLGSSTPRRLIDLNDSRAEQAFPPGWPEADVG
ncbi:DNA-binding CsgD family transcriptional regulator [Spinactinospora alkalitolerans]|uniref:DNA-binding CsgD family transcriptional regulator n=1 Tax=Spinactinospora alkalitolerans TaxID=687207 RepID=A0A852U532_9ACTN|nr:replication-relaxation family protein [Spinactinospora alkalitolerans]NYE50003.1 DNA-binding CsgD family transcriptional regulator [Spinactinospora alkalitolerans]